jgi:hypothetical protein
MLLVCLCFVCYQFELFVLAVCCVHMGLSVSLMLYLLVFTVVCVCVYTVYTCLGYNLVWFLVIWSTTILLSIFKENMIIDIKW